MTWTLKLKKTAPLGAYRDNETDALAKILSFQGGAN